jgi:O-antigen ligase/tetratricopeptide (TPR) repeat protein
MDGADFIVSSLEGGAPGGLIRYSRWFMDRPRALGLAFLAVWAFGLAWNGGVSVEATTILTVAVAILNILAARLLPDQIRLSRWATAFFVGIGAVFLVQLLPAVPFLFPVTASWRLRHGIEGWWWQGTADAYRTLLTLTTFLLYALSALLIIRLRQSGVGVSTMLRAAVAVLSAEAIYGIFQVFAGLKEVPFYGPRPLPDVASGTLVGRNNFAGLIAVGFVLALSLTWGRFAWPLRRSDDTGKPRWLRRTEGSAIWAMATGLFAIALVLSRSRGGALAALGGAALLPFIHRGRGSIAGTAGIAVLVLGAISTAGIQPLLDRFAGMGSHDLTSEARWTIFTTTAQAALHQPILGFGFGTHPVAYHPYQPPSLSGQVHHAHSEYINIFFEAGFVGAAIVILALIAWFLRTWRAQQPLPGPDRLYLTATIAAVAVTALHSFVDFDLRIPSNGMLFATLVGIGASASRGGVDRPYWIPGLAALALLGTSSLFVGLDPVMLTEQARSSTPETMDRLASRALGLSPYEYRAAWTRARAAQHRSNPKLADHEFESASDLWPAHPDVQRAAGIWFWAAKDPRATICFRRMFAQEPEKVPSVMEELWGTEGRTLGDYESLLPSSPQAAAYFANFLVKLGKWSDAIPLFDSRVPAIAVNAYLYDFLAAALDEVGQWGIEAVILDRRVAVKSDPSAYAASATAWLKLGNHSRALEMIDTACRIDPGNGAWLALRGDILRSRGDRLDAAQSFTEALGRSPMELRYREARGWTYLELKLFDLAAQDFREALRSKPLDRYLVLGLAQALVGLNQSDSAGLLLDDYLRESPEDKEVQSFRRSMHR